MPNEDNTRELFLRMNGVEQGMARIEEQMKHIQGQGKKRDDDISEIKEILMKLQTQQAKNDGVRSVLLWLAGVITSAGVAIAVAMMSR